MQCVLEVKVKFNYSTIILNVPILFPFETGASTVAVHGAEPPFSLWLGFHISQPCLGKGET